MGDIPLIILFRHFDDIETFFHHHPIGLVIALGCEALPEGDLVEGSHLLLWDVFFEGLGLWGGRRDRRIDVDAVLNLGGNRLHWLEVVGRAVDVVVGFAVEPAQDASA